MIVRLKGRERALKAIEKRSFNSMIVRLKGRLLWMLLKKKQRFNSMIVRLKDPPQRPRLRGGAEFQFYDSPIKRSPRISNTRRST